MEHFGNDMFVVVADERPWPSRTEIIRDSSSEKIIRDGWGQVKREQPGTGMSEIIEVAIKDYVDPDTLEFENPLADSRYERSFDDQFQNECCLFCKTGGPYLRTAFLRGEQQLWIDVMDDPEWVQSLVDRITDHLICVGVESIHRWRMYDTGIEINDDVAANWGPFVGPDIYEQIFLPALRRMVVAYKKAGARYIMHHADGNVEPLLDMWIDAGIDAIHPVEYRSGMDPIRLHERYSDRLTLIGGTG